MRNAADSPGFLHLLRLSDGADWLHMCIRHAETGTYLKNDAELNDLVVEAMIEGDTRSRLRVQGDGLMLLLKAMHLKGEEMARPEDMVSMRVWLDPTRVITTREADVDPILELGMRVKRGDGPATPGAFLCDLIHVHLDEVDEQLEMLEDAVDQIDSHLAGHQLELACPNMADSQARIAGFLRHLAPQRPVLDALASRSIPMLDQRDRIRLEDQLNRLLRFVESLQNLRERIDILNAQVTRIQDRKLNRSSYVLAAVATVFLPLNFITSLFGVNLPGLPFSDTPHGFWVLCALCASMAAVVLVLFRMRRGP